ncbi:hypothetical protein e2701_00049 [Klebsiella phage e270.1]|uniref:hypothetical protein n=1 Tax=Klebsiella pneumoniae TaxID=573 RepID=UPI000F7F1DB8|nr:hypothetical protein [Klebsiella pneumoniae]WDQ26660.1 hypothetical protein phiKPNH21_00048 [Klebsiella phage phi_KPN_H2]WMT10400.1 hypothetical protein phi270_00005 [Klebsiella phage phi_270]WMT10608.1 hypothetical protein e2701_00049 [Klebsiella phage e270.1]WMT10694.1 hypothetical protein e2702_00048 [Klebsiella phage e270.2]RTA29644.1 hypothetical protein EJ496_28110 [Klebsiella pneumoniae subsp. pneumoniae]
MNISDVSGVVYNRVLDNLPVEITPDRFTIASGNLPDDTTGKPGLILTHNPGPWAITTLGGEGVCRRRLRTGNVFLQVRTPAQYGMDTLSLDIADRLARLFEGIWQDRPLLYTGVDVRYVGRDNAWFLANTVITYEFEEVY